MNPTFFVVDDSRAIQAIIKRSIDASGYRGSKVHVHANAEDALSALDRIKPDLLITDWHMPGMSGLELLQSLRQIHGKDLKVGMITTEVSTDLLRRARDQGVEFILSKPFTDAELRQGILNAIGPPGDPDTATDSPPKAAPAEATVSAQALPEPEPAVAAESPPDAAQRLQNVLTNTLGAIKFRLIPCEAPTAQHFAPQLMLVLYSLPGTKKAYAFGLLDLASVCMIGGGGLGLLPDSVRPAIRADAPSDVMIKRASTFMQEAAAVLVQPDGTVPIASRGALVSRELERLNESMQRHTEMLNYRLQIPGYGEGRMGFVVL